MINIPFGVKIGLAISLLAVGITTFNVYLFYSRTYEMVYTQTVNRLADMGRTGAFLFDEAQQESIKRLTLAIEENALSIPTQKLKEIPEGDSIEGLPEEVAKGLMASADFQTLVQTLRKIKAGSRQAVTPLGQQLGRLSTDPTDPYKLKYAYVFVKLPQFAPFDLVSFVADADYDEPGMETAIGLLLRPDTGILRTFQGNVEVSEDYYTDQWGTFISAWIPIKDTNGQVIAIYGLDAEVTGEMNQLNDLWNLCAMILAVSVVLSLLLAYVIARWLGQPIAKLRVGAQQLRDGDFSTSIEIKSRDEFGALAETFNQMTAQLKGSFATLEEKNQELQRLDQLKDEFLANTSHELRTPLNGIVGIAESLVDGAAGSLSEPVQKNLLMIAQSGHRLTNLVNDILDFSKLKHHDLCLQLKPLELHSIVSIVLTLSQPLIANKKELDFINTVKLDLPAVFADENRLQQILHNLIGNAIKFTDRGHITISAQVINEQQVQITIADDGIGIPADKLDSIFKSFEQAEGSTERKYGGTGLGLAVTKKLVTLHRGKIWVESTLGTGSKFIFTLPSSQQPAVPLSSKRPKLTHSIAHILDVHAEESSVVQTATNTATFKVLMVDDEPVNLQVLHNYLSLQNYRIVQATSGRDALKFIEDGFIPDVILLDVMMPQMTGYEFTHKLRKKWQATEMPILLLTAKNQVEDLVQGLEIGANDYMTKPISKGELLARIKTHLSLKTLTADLNSVSKASKILAGEIVLSHFLEKMMYIVIENAGAERGFLLLLQGEQWLIEAEGAINQQEVTTLHSLPAKNHLPEAIFNDVARTHENVVLANAKQQGLYTENPYIKAHQTQSVLCFPIVHQQQLRAILYLENNLMSGAFTKERLKVLTMLSSQIAISLENAQIMANLDSKVKERTAQLNSKVQELIQTRHELVQSEKMAALGQLVAGIAHEVNTPLGAIRSSAETLTSSLKQTLAQFPRLFKVLTKTQQETFFDLLDRSLQNQVILTVKEKRAAKKILTAELKQCGIANPRIFADIFISLSIYAQTNQYLPLLQNTNSEFIFEIAYNVSTLTRSTKNITTAVERASKVIFALKTFARYDQSGEKKTASLQEGLETVLTLYHNQIKQGIELIREYVDLPPIKCYPDELNQVWTNILHNALQAMGYKGRLKVAISQQDNYAVVAMTDSGQGIPSEIKDQIFTPFFTTKAAGEGSGLGLDIVKKIIDKHDGKIEVDSEVGKGTTFSIWLPME